MSNKIVVLADGHWMFMEFKQQMPVRAWRDILLAGQHEIFFRGHLRRLVARPLGAGVVEVSKAPEEPAKPDKPEVGCRSCAVLHKALAKAVVALETNATLWAESCPQGIRQSAEAQGALAAARAGRRALARAEEKRK